MNNNMSGPGTGGMSDCMGHMMSGPMVGMMLGGGLVLLLLLAVLILSLIVLIKYLRRPA